MTALLDGTRDVRALKGPRLCTVGTGTAERLARYGIKVDLMPDEFRAEARGQRADATPDRSTARRVLLPRADIGREVIAEELRDGRRGRHRGRRLPHGARRRAAGRRPGHLPDAARRRDRRRDVHEPVGGAQLRRDLRRGAGGRPAHAHRGGRDRAGHGRGGAPAGHRR